MHAHTSNAPASAQGWCHLVDNSTAQTTAAIAVRNVHRVESQQCTIKSQEGGWSETGQCGNGPSSIRRHLEAGQSCGRGGIKVCSDGRQSGARLANRHWPSTSSIKMGLPGNTTKKQITLLEPTHILRHSCMLPVHHSNASQSSCAVGQTTPHG